MYNKSVAKIIVSTNSLANCTSDMTVYHNSESQVATIYKGILLKRPLVNGLVYKKIWKVIAN